MPFASRSMDEAALGQEFQDLGNVVTAKQLAGLERQLKRGALKMADQNMNVVGIDQAHLGRLAQKIFRVMDNELIQWRAGRHEHGHRHSAATAGTSDALPGRSDRARITCKHGGIETANIDAEFQGIGRNDAADMALSQSPFDLAAL